MPRLSCFPPVVSEATRTLVLGTMPGQASLLANEYYAHPRNQFWPIMEALFSIERGWPYPQRTAALLKLGVGLWDVLESCVREGSLDSSIQNKSVVINDFNGLLRDCPKLNQIVFNGAMAEQLFRRHAMPRFDKGIRPLEMARLPSTSPAHASLNLQSKLLQWRCISSSA
ncbi:MAG: DNA-deoxyinosine glycosylase [Pseudomonadota bacterium]